MTDIGRPQALDTYDDCFGTLERRWALWELGLFRIPHVLMRDIGRLACHSAVRFGLPNSPPLSMPRC